MKNNSILFLIFTIILIMMIFFSGCISNGVIKPLNKGVDIIFASNRDTGNRRRELYGYDIENNEITRISFTKNHHFIFGVDKSSTPRSGSSNIPLCY